MGTPWDLVVVGAGPGGSAAALAALREKPDARVLILDRAPLGRYKVCGDGIAPHAVSELAALGVDVVRPEEIVSTVRLYGPSGTDAGAVTTSPGYVVPRRQFDERLLSAALEAGASFEVRKVTSLASLDAKVIIGADGSNSTVRRLIGQKANHGRALAVALRGYAPSPKSAARELTIRWDSQRSGGLCYAWSFPVADGTTNVGYGLSSAARDHSRAYLERRLGELLPEFDLTGVELTGHTLPLSVRRPQPAVGNVLLVGDAASLINPFTGEGIYSAIVSGALAGSAALRGPDAAGSTYAKALAARFGRQHRQTTALYRIIDSPRVLDTVIRAARASSTMFDRLLDVGLGDAAFSLADFARFGRYAF